MTTRLLPIYFAPPRRARLGQITLGDSSMPLLKGAMGFRRYRVINAPSTLASEDMLEALAKHAFRKPPSAATGGETPAAREILFG